MHRLLNLFVICFIPIPATSITAVPAAELVHVATRKDAIHNSLFAELDIVLLALEALDSMNP